MEQELLLMLLQALYGQPVAYLKEEKIYGVIGEINDGMLPIYPIVNSPTSEISDVIWVKPNDPNLKTVPMLQLPRSENFGNNRVFFGQFSEISRDFFGKNPGTKPYSAGSVSGTDQKSSGKKLSKDQQRIADYYRIDDFSILYDGHLAELCENVYFLTLKALGNTSKSKTIDKILGLYEEARKKAKKGGPRELQRLREIVQSLHTLIEQQKRVQENAALAEKKKKRKIARQIITGIIAVMIAIYLALGTPWKKKNESKNAATSSWESYHIIIGSFSQREKAEKAAREGYIIASENIYRVGIDHYSTLDSAKKMLEEVRKEYPQAWILKTEGGKKNEK